MGVWEYFSVIDWKIDKPTDGHCENDAYTREIEYRCASTCMYMYVFKEVSGQKVTRHKVPGHRVTILATYDIQSPVKM